MRKIWFLYTASLLGVEEKTVLAGGVTPYNKKTFTLFHKQWLVNRVNCAVVGNLLDGRIRQQYQCIIDQKMGTVEDDDELDTDEEQTKSEKWKKHYSSKHKILLVGEGDFSFSLSLATAFGSAHNLVATSLDSQGQTQPNKVSVLIPEK